MNFLSSVKQHALLINQINIPAAVSPENNSYNNNYISYSNSNTSHWLLTY